MINCVVIFGGESCEHDISIVTGLQVFVKLDKSIYNAIPIYIDKKGVWWTGENLKDVDNFPDNLGKLKRVSFIGGDNCLYVKKGKKYLPLLEIDFAFICMHGVNGEDGSVSAILKLCKIAYSSSAIMASSLCLDKSIFKLVCMGLNIINVVKGYSIMKEDLESNYDKIISLAEGLNFPVIIKPSKQGSSVGITICSDKNNFKKCLEESFKYDDCVVIEKYIDIDKEINIALYSDRGEIVFSQTEEPVYYDEILSFEDKYLKNINGFEGISRITPANISSELEDKIKEIAKTLYIKLKMFGVVRFDFILSKDGILYVNEVNTIPGSMANYLFNDITFGKLLDNLRINSIIRYNKEKNILSNFESSFLSEGRDFIKK